MPDDIPTGAMIALYLPPNVAGQVALGGGEPPGRLHCTLIYLGEASEITDVNKLIIALASFAESCQPVRATLNGLFRFTNTTPNAFGLNVDSPELPELRQRLMEWVKMCGCNPPEEHGFSPHVTLTYLEANEDVPLDTAEPLPVVFETLTLALADKRYDFPFAVPQGAPNYGLAPTCDNCYWEDKPRCTLYNFDYEQGYICDSWEPFRWVELVDDSGLSFRRKERDSMPQNMRAYLEQIPEAGEPLTFVAATEGVKRDGLDIRMAGGNLDKYRANPVVLWVHDYQGSRLPIGRAEVEIEGDKLKARTFFDPEDDFARQVESKYRRGFLNAVSIGWDTVKKEGRVITEWELLDLSAVPVPGDWDALLEKQRLYLRSLSREIDQLLGEPETPQPEANPELPQDEPESRAVIVIDEERLQDLVTRVLEARYAIPAGERAGAMLSGRNMGDLQEACRLIQGVIDRAAPASAELTTEDDDEEAMRLLGEIDLAFSNKFIRS